MVDHETLDEELIEKGIKPDYFNQFYESMKQGNLPTKEDDPEQYDLVSQVLQEYEILDSDMNIDEEKLEYVEARRKLDKSIEDLNKTLDDASRDDDHDDLNTGGLMPCRDDDLDIDDPFYNSGGLMPCR